MHLTPSDPDISTIIRKIEEGRLDLQPNFQRGEVWGKQKKQRLIDSILRGWHIPPIHVIQVADSNKQEVLDGQQRLAAIRDFFNNEFPIDGEQQPHDPRILALDGKYFDSLDGITQASIEDFTIRVLTISDYDVGEPGELFYRLNQPTNLTSAEQRNAYFGQARQQVKALVDLLLQYDFNTQTIGFSNSRMAYDDVIAKCLMTIESNSLSEKITSSLVTSRYRDSEGFHQDVVTNFEKTLHSLSLSIKNRSTKTKLNKATLYTWLLFYYQVHFALGISQQRMDEFFDSFEILKTNAENFGTESDRIAGGPSASFVRFLLAIFIDRASSRVADVSSVKLRDMVLWKFFFMSFPTTPNQNISLREIDTNLRNLERREKVNEKDLLETLSQINWEGIFS
jgi:hypothetical protein